MSELTDRLVGERLRESLVLMQAYRTDPFYHAEVVMFRHALDAAHRALTESGNPEANRIVEVLALGVPNLDPDRRTALAHKLIAEHEVLR